MIEIIDTIFIDTSVFQKEAYFKSTGRVSKLFDLAKQGYIRILLPVITEKEWFKHFMEGAKFEFPDFGRKLSVIGSNKQVDEFLKRYSELKSSIDFDDELKKSFKRHVNGLGVERIDYSYFEDRLEIVFDKYFKKEKPFGSNGKSKEFPDAFVLAGLEKYAIDNSIDKIIVFSADNDMKNYNSDILHYEDMGLYLDDFIQNRIDALHIDEQRRDVDKLLNFMRNAPSVFKQRILDRAKTYLDDVDRFSRRFNYAEIEEVYNIELDLDISENNVELLSIDDNQIEADVFPTVFGTIQVKYFDEEDSVWDPEDKEWIIKSYGNVKLEISSFLIVTIKMDRHELEIGQGPCVEILDVDFSTLQESVDKDIYCWT